MSYTSDRKFVLDLADAVVSIFNGGKNTASAMQIARAHYGDRSYNINVVMDVQAHLKQVKKILDSDYQLPVVLVHKDAYEIIKKGGPTTEADAVKCLPSGKGRSSDGIHLCNSKDDLIYETAIKMGLRRAAGAHRRNMERLLDVHERGHIEGQKIIDIASDVADRQGVASPSDVARAVKARHAKELQNLAAHFSGE